MLDFKHWELAKQTRDTIIKLDSSDKVEAHINKVIESLRQENVSESDILEFVRHLNSLFLTYMITEAQDHSQSLDNVKRARERLKQIEQEQSNNDRQ